MVLGLTGGYCAGKDAAARVFSRMGFTVIDVDAVGHDVLRQKAGEVAEAFCRGLLLPDGGINRGALGSIVFADPAALARLEAIMHPAMFLVVRDRVRAAPGDVLINAAVLVKIGLTGLCDAVICMTAPLPLRVLRGMRRDRATPLQVLRRIRSQKGLCPKSHGFAVDTHSVNNRGSLRRLEKDLAVLWRRLRERKGL
jgi:dephospho-CoA kinase